MTHTWQWGQHVWEEESTSQHSGWGRTTAGLSLKRRLMSSAVSKERRQNSHAAYLYSSFHENCAHTSGVSVRITSRSLKFVLAYNPLPWKKKKKEEESKAVVKSAENMFPQGRAGGGVFGGLREKSTIIFPINLKKNQTFGDILAWKKDGVCVALYSVCVPIKQLNSDQNSGHTERIFQNLMV